MKDITLKNIVSVTGGQLYYGDINDETEATCVVIDSRLIQKGGVFAASVGERVDSHKFIEDMFAKEAMAVICEKLPEKQFGPCILVEDSLAAVKKLASFYRDKINAKVIGVSGSVGKTSTKEFLAGVLSKKFSVLKTLVNSNNELGVALTILRVMAEHEIAVVEMGINQFGEMERLSAIARPDACVLTNIGDCHLEMLGDRDGVLKAKSEIYRYMPEGGQVFVNGDDDKLATLNVIKGQKVIKVGFDGEDLDYCAINFISKGLKGSSASVKTMDNNTVDIEVVLPGKHMVYNALTAMAVARYFDMDYEQICQGISDITPVGGRSNILDLNGLTVIDDCYNANPTSCKAAIDLLGQAETRKVAVLGDMFELGVNENQLHKQVGEYGADTKIDVLVFIGELSKNGYDAAVLKNADAHYFKTVSEFFDKMTEIICAGDTVLVKASHGMNFAEIVKKFQENY